MPDKKRDPRNPSLRERVAEAGGLDSVSDNTRALFGANRNTPLGHFNKWVLNGVDGAYKALQIAGHGAEWAATAADNVAIRTGAADRLSWQGNRFLPGTAVMALGEAFPMEGALGAAGAEGRGALRGARYAASKAKSATKPALKRATETVREIARDESGHLKLPDKRIKAAHYSDNPTLSETDPARWGDNKRARFIPPEERRRMRTAPGRTYFGLQEGEGVTKPYGKETGVGPYRYDADLSAERLYDHDGDPMGLREKGRSLPTDENGRYVYGDKSLDGTSLYEQLIKDAGYAGYRSKNDSLGDVAALFEPVPVTRTEQPIQGLPTRTKINGELRDFGPFDPLRQSARSYTSDAGIDYTPPTRYAPANPEFHTRVAEAYDRMRHDPQDPEVAQAYQALKDELVPQYQRLAGDGYEFSFHRPDENPYPNPWEAIADLRDNKQMKVYPTDAGFGSGAGLSAEDIANNPLLEQVPGLQWPAPGGSRKPVTYNDVFRAVHDAYGHAKEGVGFRASGENAAYLQHLPMFSPAAQRALASETLGQNSWLNFGPHGAANRAAKVEDTVFADQKNGLLPDELIYGGQAAEFMPDPRSTGYGKREVVRGQMSRTWDDAGLEKVLGQREIARTAARRREAMEAPAIIKGPLKVQPDFQYPPTYTGLRNGIKQADMDIKVDDLPMAPRKVISPEDIQGSTLIAGMADRTRAGGILRQVNDMRFFDPVNLQGGQDFMRQQAGTGSVWAGDLGPVRGVLRRAGKQDGDVYYAPFTMGGKAGDYSTMMSDAIVEALQRTPKGTRADLDALMRQVDPEFVGTWGVTRDAEPLRTQLRQKPGLRTSLAKTLDSAKWQKAGGPDIGMLRQAITDPRQIDVPTESFGYSLGKIDKEGDPLLNPVNPHDTYRAHLPGEYEGGFEAMVPPNLMFPDAFNAAVQGPKGRSGVSYALKFGPPVQKADQQWLDGIMPYMEWAKSVGHINW